MSDDRARERGTAGRGTDFQSVRRVGSQLALNPAPGTVAGRHRLQICATPAVPRIREKPCGFARILDLWLESRATPFTESFSHWLAYLLFP